MLVSRRTLARRVAGFAALCINACRLGPPEPPPLTQAAGPTPAAGATISIQPTAPVAPPTLLPAPPTAITTVAPVPATVEPTAPPPTPTAAPSPTSAPTIDIREQGQKRYIAHTDGMGVRLRSRCADEAVRSGGWREGTEVIVEYARPDCPGWVFVRPLGEEASWVSTQYLSSLPPTRALPPRTSSRSPTETFVIGRSVQGRLIQVMRVGTGPVAVAFIGNIHGGWEPVARDVVEVGLNYFLDHPSEVPPPVTLYFVPTMNPDGYEDGRPLWSRASGMGGSGDAALARTAFNANGVDLNRNFAEHWDAQACGGERVRLAYGTVCRAALGGREPFSEPETQAYRGFILGRRIRWALTYHEDRVPSILIREGGGGPSEPFAQELSALFGYPYIPRTLAYKVTGHAWDWLDANGVVGAEIELKDRTRDWDRNLSAMKLLIQRALLH